jgi:hypothetical protein
MTLCAIRGEAPDECGEKRSDYQRTTGLPALAVSRRPGFNPLWSRVPGRHAYAPKLDRAWPWSVRSAVRMRAIGTTTMRRATRHVKKVCDTSCPQQREERPQCAVSRPQRTIEPVGQLRTSGALTHRATIPTSMVLALLRPQPMFDGFRVVGFASASAVSMAAGATRCSWSDAAHRSERGRALAVRPFSTSFVTTVGGPRWRTPCRRCAPIGSM